MVSTSRTANGRTGGCSDHSRTFTLWNVDGFGFTGVTLDRESDSQVTVADLGIEGAVEQFGDDGSDFTALGASQRDMTKNRVTPEGLDHGDDSVVSAHAQVVALGDIVGENNAAAFAESTQCSEENWSLEVLGLIDNDKRIGEASSADMRERKNLKEFAMDNFIDDLGAIVLIAMLFTSGLSWLALGLGALCAGALLLLNRYGVTRLLPYLACGALLWLCVLKSGVHATLAGVFTGMVIPLRGKASSPARHLEHALHPWVKLGILPLFALANAGVALSGVGLSTLLHPVTLGTALGLFVGKQAGVFGACFLAIRSGWCTAPAGANWQVLYGASVLTGIGFTMSLFIGSLAFPNGEYDQMVRTGVLLGSALSIALGLAWLLRLPRHTAR